MKLVRYTVLFIIFGFISLTSVYPQNDGDNFFNSYQIHTFNITFSQPNFWDSLTYYYTIDKYMAADVEIDGTMLPSTGVQLKGNSSYNSYPGQKKSMNIDFNEFVSGQDYDGLKKLNLNNGFKDPTMLREKIFLEFCKMIGMPAPRCTFGKVYINGTYWGLYTAVEQVNKSFLDIQFNDKKGNLFKGDPHGDLMWKGATVSNYYGDYELKTNEDINDWSDLVHLIDKINNTSNTAYYDTLEKYMDSDTYLKYWAANIVFSNLDSYTGSGHNYYIYHDSTSLKFQWIMWDVNEAFGNFNMGMDLNAIQGLDMFFIPNPQQNRPLSYKMLQNSTYYNMYIDKVCDITENFFRHDILDPMIDSLADDIRTDLYADTKKMFTNQQFEDNINMAIYVAGLPGGGNIAGLKSFITSRRDSLQLQLAAFGCYLDVNDYIHPDFNITLTPNPASDQIHVILAGNDIPDKLSVALINYTGQLKYTETLMRQNEFNIDISGLPAGIYLLTVNNETGRKVVIN